jgi:beta-lactamase regulating signal transducer with metallopeptidase domain
MNLTFTLGWTLIHFLWQGTLIALLLGAICSSFRRATARMRYALGCAAMLLMLVCVVVTFARLSASAPDNQSVSAVTTSASAPSLAATSEVEVSASGAMQFSSFLPWMVYCWIAGVCLLTVRSLGGWMTLQRFKRQNAFPAEPAWQQRMARLAQRLSISRAVKLCESAIAEAPAVIGWMRPVVLLPASALTGLAPEQLEALLAHELAHIRRHDYLLNLFQTCVETLLFYHPAVWWVGKRIRAERENCCDDLAVQVCGDALAYARALTQMEQLRCDAPRLAMAANRGPLLQRIQRLLSRPQPARTGSTGWIAIAAITLIVATAWASPRLLRSGTITMQEPYNFDSPAPVSSAPARPAPDKFATVPTAVLVSQAAPAPAKPSPAVEPRPQARPQSNAPEAKGPGFIDDMDKAGYHNLTVDQLIALKIHDVTGEYIRQIRAEGYQPTVDQLVALKIHNVTPQYVDQLKQKGLQLDIDHLLAFRIHNVDPAELERMSAQGYKLNPDQALAMRIHGLTPELANNVKALGLGTPTFDQLLAMKIHGVDAEFLNGMKGAGVQGLNLDNLLALKIHGADPGQIKEMAALGFKDLSADQVLAASIHGVTPQYIRDLRNRGFKDLSVEQIIKLKQAGIE